MTIQFSDESGFAVVRVTERQNTGTVTVTKPAPNTSFIIASSTNLVRESAGKP